MKLKNRKKIFFDKKNLFLMLIVLAVVFMSIGYSSINSVSLDLNGIVSIKSSPGIYIYDASIASGTNGADTTNSRINTLFNSVMNSTIILGNNSASTLTLNITMYNTTNDNTIFTGVTYSENFYDNNNITYDFSGLSVGTILPANSNISFTMTFRYTGNDTTRNILNSYIKFDFEKYYTITYSNINTNNQNYPTYILDSESTKTITFNTDIPYDVHITPTVSYTYSNPVLTLNNVKNNITINRYYSITYNLNGGTNPSGQPTKFLHGTSETILDPTYQNHTFVGWYRNASFTGSPVTTTSGISENLVLYAKWSSGSYETAATYIASLVGNASTNSTNIITVSAPTGETCTNTFAYDGTSDNNLRYVGLDPCNYIKFNCDSNDNCELWRIIGVMNGIDTNPVLKIVAPLSSTTRPWNTTTSPNWESASLNDYLNNDYLSSLNNGVISNYVLNAQWNIGKVAYNTTTPNFYSGERATKSANHYIGIISPSDYGYATSATSDSTRNSCISAQLSGNSYTNDCVNNNYLFQGTGLYQWTITANNSGNYAIRLSNAGRTYRWNIGNSYSYNYMPTVYLKSNIKIKTTTGNGSSNSPYELEKIN